MGATMSVAPPGGKWHDQTHWPRWIGSRVRKLVVKI
jgi:hypothetical protein